MSLAINQTILFLKQILSLISLEDLTRLGLISLDKNRKKIIIMMKIMLNKKRIISFQLIIELLVLRKIIMVNIFLEVQQKLDKGMENVKRFKMI